jgi:hypothetical protein
LAFLTGAGAGLVDGSGEGGWGREIKMSKEPERVFLHLSFAQGQCIKMNRDGGFRLIMDVPECDAAQVQQLAAWRDRVMFAGVQVDDGNNTTDEGEAKASKGGKAKGTERRWP